MRSEGRPHVAQDDGDPLVLGTVLAGTHGAGTLLGMAVTGIRPGSRLDSFAIVAVTFACSGMREVGEARGMQ